MHERAIELKQSEVRCKGGKRSRGVINNFNNGVGTADGSESERIVGKRKEK